MKLVSMIVPSATAALLLSAVNFGVLAANVSHLAVRRTLLADGTSNQYGSTSDGLLKWQASGVLYSEGTCTGSTNYPISITNCYSIQLSADPTKNLDQGHLDSPRQRVEFLPVQQKTGGDSMKYTWRSYVSSQTGTTNNFFHLMQIFSNADGGPVVTLDLVGGKAKISSSKHCPSGTTCPSVDLDSFTDRTLLHTMSITFGTNGKLNYKITDATTGATIINYSTTGYLGSDTDTSYLKFGMYRAAVNGITTALGDFGAFTQATA